MTSTRPATLHPPSPDDPSRTPARTHVARLAVLVLVVAAGWSLVNRLDSGGGAALDDGASDTATLTRTGASIDELEQASRTAPDDPELLQRLGSAYLQRSVESLDPSDNVLAEQAFDRADAIEPGAVPTTLGRAGLAATRHDFIQALTLTERVLENNPYSAEALALRVDASLELGRYEQAEAHLQELLDRRPGAVALARVAYFRELHGDREGALAAIRSAEAAAAAAPATDRARLAAIHGDVLFGGGRIDEARDAYRRALDLDPDLPTAVLGRARADAASGDVERATASLERLVEQRPLPSAAMLLAELHSQAGRTRDAAAAAELVRASSALERSTGSEPDWDPLVFEADGGRIERASLESARRAAMTRPSIYGADALAWMQFRSGHLDAAASTIEGALRTGSDDARILFHASMIFEAVGDAPRATVALEGAARSNPWFSFARQDEARALADRLDVDWPVQ